MEKYIKIFKNLGILTIGQFSSKILVFLLVPLYTSVLTTEEYGAYDFILTTINLLLPIITLNIAVSSQRFLLNHECDESQIVKVSFKYTFIGIAIAFLFVLANYFLKFSDIILDYSFGFFLLFFFMSLNIVLVDIAIGTEQIKYVSVSGVLSTFTTIVLCILLLVVVRMGLIGYFIANIVGMASQTSYLLVKLKIIKMLKEKTGTSPNLEKEMLNFSRPQIANNISWWINNAADRYVLIWFWGVGINGIYSVAYKIPAIINMLGGIFAQATGVSIIKNFDAEDKDNFFSNIYKAYNVFLVLTCSVLIILTRVIARMMYANDFYVAWKFAPFLLIASVFGALAGYVGNTFSATYAAKEFAMSTVIGAFVNIILNFLLVPFWGAIWAAVATLISYCVIWILRFYHMRKFIKADIKIARDVIAYVLLTMQGVVVNITAIATVGQYAINMILLVILLIIFRDDLSLVIKSIKRVKK